MARYDVTETSTSEADPSVRQSKDPTPTRGVTHTPACRLRNPRSVPGPDSGLFLPSPQVLSGSPPSRGPLVLPATSRVHLREFVHTPKKYSAKCPNHKSCVTLRCLPSSQYSKTVVLTHGSQVPVGRKGGVSDTRSFPSQRGTGGVSEQQVGESPE